MQRYIDTVQDKAGTAVPGAQVYVRRQGGSLATIYSDNGVTAMANPLRTDSLGTFAFYAADGRYNLEIRLSGVLFGSKNDILLEDPNDDSPGYMVGGHVKNALLEGNTGSDGRPLPNLTQIERLAAGMGGITQGDPLVDAPQWDAVPAVGNAQAGSLDPINAQAQALSNRTSILKARADTTEDKLLDLPSPTEHGGTTGADATSAVQAAQNASPGGVYLPPGDWIVGSGVDTSRVYGPGNLVPYAGATQKTPPALRKDWSNGNRSRQPFEDEHYPHLEIDGYQLNYTAFGGACMLNGHELHTARTAYEHVPNHNYKSACVLYTFEKESYPAIAKRVIYESAPNLNIQDTNICPHPNRAGIALISFAEKIEGGSYQTRLITWNDNTQTVESNRVLLGMDGSYKWGNALITPAGHLLLCSYALNGTSINVWRSTAPLPTSGDVTMALASSITDTVASEPTIGYWREKLVLFYRRTGAASRITYSFDKEGAGPWAATVFPYGVSAHAPSVVPYSDADIWTAFFSLGVSAGGGELSRARVGAVSTMDLVRFKGSTPIKMAGLRTGGYSPMIDCGGYYAITVYSEHYDEPGQPKRTRFERIEIDKTRVDIGQSDQARLHVIDLPPAQVSTPGQWIGTPFGAGAKYTSNGLDYSTEIEVTRQTVINGVSWFTAFNGASGTGSAYVEIYEDGVLIATSNINAGVGIAPSAVVFDLASNVTLKTLKKYKLKLKGINQMALYDMRHGIKITAIGRCQQIEYVGAYSASGTSIASTSIIPVGLRIAL